MKTILINSSLALFLTLSSCEKDSTAATFPSSHQISNCEVNGLGFAHEGVKIPTPDELWKQIREMRIKKLSESQEDLNFVYQYQHLSAGRVDLSQHTKLMLISHSAEDYEVLVYLSLFSEPLIVGKFTSYDDALVGFETKAKVLLSARGDFENDL